MNEMIPSRADRGVCPWLLQKVPQAGLGLSSADEGVPPQVGTPLQSTQLTQPPMGPSPRPSDEPISLDHFAVVSPGGESGRRNRRWGRTRQRPPSARLVKPGPLWIDSSGCSAPHFSCENGDGQIPEGGKQELTRLVPQPDAQIVCGRSRCRRTSTLDSKAIHDAESTCAWIILARNTFVARLLLGVVLYNLHALLALLVEKSTALLVETSASTGLHTQAAPGELPRRFCLLLYVLSQSLSLSLHTVLDSISLHIALPSIPVVPCSRRE